MDADVPPYVQRGRFPFSGAPCETTLNTMCWAALGLLWSLTRFLLSLCLLSPTITHNAFLLLHGSLEVCWVCFHTQEVGWIKLRLCVSVRVCVREGVCIHCVCLCRKRRTVGGKKSLPDLLTELFFKNTPTWKKETRGKTTENRHRKSTAKATLSSFLFYFIFLKQTLGGLDKLLRDQLYFESGDSDAVRKPRGVAMTKIIKKYLFTSWAEEGVVHSASGRHSAVVCVLPYDRTTVCGYE